MDQKPKRSKVWGPFFHLLRITKLPYWLILIKTVIMLSSSQLRLMFPQYTQKIMAGDVGALTLTVMVLVVLGQALLTGVIQAVTYVTTSKISLRFRESIWAHIVHLPVSYYDEHMPRELINRVTSDTATLSDTIASLPGSLLSNIYVSVGTFAILFSYDWRLLLVEVIVIPLAILAGVLEGRVRFRQGRAIQQRSAELTGFLAEIMLHIPLVKTFVKESHEEQRGDACIEELYHTDFKYKTLYVLVTSLGSLVSVVNTIVAIVFGIWLISRGEITIDVWIAFYLYSQELLNCVRGFMADWASVKAVQGSANRIAEIALSPAEKYEGGKDASCREEISLDSVSFRYRDKDVLQNVSIRIPAGKTTAIVGPSGSGKSTMLRLLERFYAVNGGVIRADGKAIDSLDLEVWRRSAGYVAQDTLLFSGTLRENILYGVDREVDEAEFDRAVRLAYVNEFAGNLEGGYDAQVGEGGGKLSGGQRQRVAIARAILRDPSLLLLDEVTANLDAEAEAKIDQALKELSKGRTTVMVAHRLDSVTEAEQIIVMENGAVHGVGTHQELLKTDHLYQQMWKAQRGTLLAGTEKEVLQ